MTDSTGYGVTPHDLEQASANVNQTAESISSQLSDIRGLVVQLEDQWRGVASNTFNALMADYDAYAKMLNQALTDIASGLHRTYVNYTISENDNISNLQSVSGSIPGANFA